MTKNNKLIIKEYPKTISKIAEEKFIKDGKLIIDLEQIKISPLQTALIIFYYFDYLDFIYRAGVGRVLYKQLEKYMLDYNNIAKSYTKKVVEEMVFYRLLEKENKWGNSFLKMTRPSYQFFNGKDTFKNINEVGRIKRNVFITEHYLEYKPDKREKFKETIEIHNILQSGRLEQLEQNNVFLENITKDKQDNIIITFGILDMLDILTTNNIKEKIELINSFFNLNHDNMYFKVNVNTQDYTRCQFLQNKWNKEDIYVNASMFNGNIKFSNLNIKRYFTYAGEYKITDHIHKNSLEELEKMFIFKDKMERDNKNNTLITFNLVDKNITTESLQQRIQFLDNCILENSSKKAKYDLIVSGADIKDFDIKALKTKHLNNIQFTENNKYKKGGNQDV